MSGVIKAAHASANRARPLLSALQGLRGFAALLVVLDHSRANFATIAPTQGELGQPVSLPLGVLGVATFFVISGFIMVHIHGEDFGQAGASWNFFKRRIARIFPFYAVMTLVYTARLYLTARPPEWTDLARSLLFIPYQDSHQPYGYPVLGQGWTLNCEALFYVVFGLALFTRRGLILVAAILLALVATGSFGVFPPDSWLGFWSQPNILFFLAGIGIGISRRWVVSGPDFPVAFGLALACIAVGATTGLLFETSAPLLILLAPAAVGATAACGLASERDQPSFVRWAAQRIGNATFAIYLTHTFIIGPAAKLATSKAPNISEWIFIPIVFVLSVSFGLAVHSLIEKPLIAVWNRLFRLGRQGSGRNDRPSTAPGL